MDNGQEDITIISVRENSAGQRLDQFLASELPSRGIEKSRSQIQSLIKSGDILVNQSKVKPRQEVSSDDQITIRIPTESSTEVGPEEMDLEVLFEDEDIIVINKAAGIVVHPGSGNPSGTLVNGLLHHCKGKLSELADEGRPGIVHRLDKETSGCLVAAKSDIAYQSLVSQFSNRETGKAYVAITAGIPGSEEGHIENHIGRHPVQRQKMTILEPPAGKLAITDYHVRHFSEKEQWAWVDCVIHTGRTHQIRVHMKEALHCPILGDQIYAQPKRQKVKVPRLMLQAWKLRITHPATGERMSFESNLPEEFERFDS